MTIWESLIWADRELFVFINQTLIADWLDAPMIAISGKYLWAPVYLYIVYLLYKKYGKKSIYSVLLLIVAFGLADSISTRVFKNGIKRERPFLDQSLHARLPDGPAGSKHGFVSSHASNTFAIYWLASLLLGLKSKRTFVFMFFAVIISYSRVYLGVHYPADVVGGALLGMAISALLYSAAKRWLYPQMLEITS